MKYAFKISDPEKIYKNKLYSYDVFQNSNILGNSSKK